MSCIKKLTCKFLTPCVASKFHTICTSVMINNSDMWICMKFGRGQLKCDGARTETRFRLSAKRTIPFKSAGSGASVQSTSGSRVVRVSGSNPGYTMFWNSVKGTGYPLRSLVSPSLPLPCVTVCHHISTGGYCRPLRKVVTSMCYLP